jgi:hypothetical protein
MVTLNRDLPDSDPQELRKRTQRAVMLMQFAFYRRLVAKKHGFTEWFEIDPAEMLDSDLEQAIAFLRDAAHLPPS